MTQSISPKNLENKKIDQFYCWSSSSMVKLMSTISVTFTAGENAMVLPVPFPCAATNPVVVHAGAEPAGGVNVAAGPSITAHIWKSCASVPSSFPTANVISSVSIVPPFDTSSVQTNAVMFPLAVATELLSLAPIKLKVGVFVNEAPNPTVDVTRIAIPTSAIMGKLFILVQTKNDYYQLVISY